jgi:hypothetical protein
VAGGRRRWLEGSKAGGEGGADRGGEAGGSGGAGGGKRALRCFAGSGCLRGLGGGVLIKGRELSAEAGGWRACEQCGIEAAAQAGEVGGRRRGRARGLAGHQRPILVQN